jgi:L-ascorbate metabolism protein UlaG (beta-lactamase superfamily)
VGRELAPAPRPPGSHGRVDRIHFLGHATLVVEVAGARLLTDPLLRDRVAHLQRVHPRPVVPPDGPLDAVLISHIHQDHLDFPSLAALGRTTRLIVPRGAAGLLGRRGFENVDELRVGEATRVGAARVIATPANHGGFRPPFGPRAECLGFIIEGGVDGGVEGAERVYFAGDTDLYAEMESLGSVDVALLPVWGWGPTLGPGHLDPGRAAIAARRIQPRLVVPIHWGSFSPWLIHRWLPAFLTRPPLEFAVAARVLAPDVAVRIVEPGGVLFAPAR